MSELFAATAQASESGLGPVQLPVQHACALRCAAADGTLSLGSGRPVGDGMAQSVCCILCDKPAAPFDDGLLASFQALAERESEDAAAAAFAVRAGSGDAPVEAQPAAPASIADAVNFGVS